eukprot:m.41412 g.41412  ORF g.41412 m.41412 type:complete len:326 (-) comp6997_c1_seq3:32-1009(-)
MEHHKRILGNPSMGEEDQDGISNALQWQAPSLALTWIFIPEGVLFKLRRKLGCILKLLSLSPSYIVLRKDLMYPHHTNELAQSESFHSCKEWVGHFMHSGHLSLNDGHEKMSKSLKNTISISNLLEENDSNTFRLFCLQSKYRSNVLFSLDALSGAASLNSRIVAFLESVQNFKKRKVEEGASLKPTPACMEIMNKVVQFETACNSAFVDDFDTPSIVKEVSNLIRHCNKSMTENSISPFPLQQAACSIRKVLAATGLIFNNTESGRGTTGQSLEAALAFREDIRGIATTLRDNKDLQQQLFNACDNFRQKLEQSGVTVKDRATK